MKSTELKKKLEIGIKLRIKDGEILVSFDMCLLFPSVPIAHILEYLVIEEYIQGVNELDVVTSY